MSAEALASAFRGQARACAELGSPFTAQLCRLSAERLTADLPLARRLFAWEGDLTPGGHNVPLRWCGAFHALVLSGRAPALAALYPPAQPDDDRLWQALVAALAANEAFLDHFLDSPPQTNEVARSAALIAVGHWLAARLGLPLRLSELGASAGLNLNWDRYALVLGDARFGPADAALTLRPENHGSLPPPAAPQVVERRGVDLRPTDAADPAQALRLRAYVWPDQAARLDRLTHALALPPAPVDAGDAAPWLAARLAEPHPGETHLVYHTIAWQYFPAATRAACLATLAEAGARATARAPLACFAMENDGQSPGAKMEITLWPGAITIPLGRIDFHGRWLDWRPPVGA